jgi:hypothetical protein
VSRLPVQGIERAVQRLVADGRSERAPQQPAVPLWRPQTSPETLRLRSCDDPRAPNQLVAAHPAQAEEFLHQADWEA